MRRPANDAKVLAAHPLAGAIRCPTSRSARHSSSGSPARREEDFAYLLAWLEEAQLDRVGAFKFEPVEGAPATSMDEQVPEDVKQERYEARDGAIRAHLRREARGEGRLDDRRPHRCRRRRERRCNRPLEGRRARDRRRSPPPRCRRFAARRHRPGASRGMRTSTTFTACRSRASSPSHSDSRRLATNSCPSRWTFRAGDGSCCRTPSRSSAGTSRFSRRAASRGCRGSSAIRPV